MDVDERTREEAAQDDVAVLIAIANPSRAAEVTAVLSQLLGDVEIIGPEGAHHLPRIAARRDLPALVVVDFAIAGASEIFERLQGVGATSILALVEERDVEAALAAGAEDVLVAPWTPSALVNRAQVARARLRRGGVRARSELARWPQETRDPLLVLDKSATILAHNSAAAALVGRAPEAINGTGLAALLGGDTLERTNAIDELISGECSDRLSGMRLVGADGHDVPCDLHVSRWWHEGAARIGLRVVEAAVDDVEEELMRIASFPELNPTPIFELSAGGDLMYRNPALLALPEAEQRTLVDDVRALVLGRRLSGAEISAREVPCGDRWYHETIHATREWDSIRVYARDITERKEAESSLTETLATLDRKVKERTADLRREVEIRKRAEEAALAANQAKSAFLATMSHELRTPLNAIIGFSELLREDAVDDQGIDDLDKIIGAAHHLLGLINDILDLSKIEAGRMELSVDVVDVRAIIELVAATTAPIAGARGNVIEAVIDPDVGTIVTDETRLRQILLNLTGNAAKFTKSGAIAIEAGIRGEWLEIRVRDTGIGIPSDKLAAIFEPFIQADGSTSREFGGTGLGLAISHKLARLLGGGIVVSSEVGVGSLFTVHLPAHPPPPVEEG
ncbi:MAG: ATP-binding protein [Nannocystaceae bacterium]